MKVVGPDLRIHQIARELVDQVEILELVEHWKDIIYLAQVARIELQTAQVYPELQALLGYRKRRVCQEIVKAAAVPDLRILLGLVIQTTLFGYLNLQILLEHSSLSGVLLCAIYKEVQKKVLNKQYKRRIGGTSKASRTSSSSRTSRSSGSFGTSRTPDSSGTIGS